ncbi:UpxY family transcription antiterminator [Chitinophaga pendula]|nr:UpxY family transcription antiterminator [Chitinophaga pendula]
MPKQEGKVVQRLTKQKVELLFPLVRKLSQWSDRRKYIDVPLFPSYVFVKVHNLKEYYDIQDTDGVLSYVRFGKEIASVNEQIINSLRIVMHQGEDIKVLTEHFSPSDTLQILEGPLKGLTCEVVKHNGTKNVLVRVNILNRVVLAHVPIPYLAAE